MKPLIDLIIDNLFILIIVASGLVKWWTDTQEAKRARENPQQGQEFDPEELEDLFEEAERRHSRPAVPPPLPTSQSGPLPGVDRSPVPNLKRKTTESSTFVPTSGVEAELARQALLAEQLKGLKLAKQAGDSTPVFGQQRKKVTAAPTGSLRSRLANRRELRQAFVLKEILEKPIGLR